LTDSLILASYWIDDDLSLIGILIVSENTNKTQKFTLTSFDWFLWSK